MAQAIQLYNECIDMDYMDYADTMEKDILLIAELLKEFSYDETKEMLMAILY